MTGLTIPTVPVYYLARQGNGLGIISGEEDPVELDSGLIVGVLNTAGWWTASPEPKTIHPTIIQNHNEYNPTFTDSLSSTDG